jgi:phosphoglycolate phosphatase-like HAD superfamily hydrolase
MPQVEKLKIFSQAAFIFDLDGTLFDSATRILEAVNSTRTSLDYPPLTILEARKLIGLPADALFSDLMLERPALERAVDSFRIALAKIVILGNPVYPRALELLTELRSRGAFIGVATSKPQALAELVITNSELDGLFDHIQGTGPLRPKPHPDTIFACLERADLARGVMIGDRIEDVLAGNEAGVMTIGIAQSTHTSQELFEAGAQHVFKTLEDLYLGIDKLPIGSAWNDEVL